MSTFDGLFGTGMGIDFPEVSARKDGVKKKTIT